jgi:hypothetical protein
MKQLILIFSMTFLTASYSQADSVKIEKMEAERYDLLEGGSFKLTMGVFSHAIGTTHVIFGFDGDPGIYYAFGIYNSFGITFDVLAIRDFVKARKKKKEIEELKNK